MDSTCSLALSRKAAIEVDLASGELVELGDMELTVVIFVSATTGGVK